MFKGTGIRLDIAARRALMVEVNKKLSIPVIADTSRIYEYRLPFYKGLKFFEIYDPTTIPPITRYVFKKRALILLADGSDEPIYAANEAASLFLSHDHIRDYIKMFFLLVGNPDAKIHPCEKADELQFVRLLTSEQADGLRENIHHMRIKMLGDDYIIDGCFIIENKLIAARLTLDKKGFVQVREQRILMEDLPPLAENLEKQIA